MINTMFSTVSYLTRLSAMQGDERRKHYVVECCHGFQVLSYDECSVGNKYSLGCKIVH